MAESALLFDTHEDIQELVKSGMPEPQAETVVRQRVRLLERNLATKADIAATNANIETLRQGTKADIETLRQETKADMRQQPTPISRRCGKKPRPISQQPTPISRRCGRRPKN